MLVYLPDQTLASLPEQFLHAVALADVRYQIQQSGVRLGRHGIRMDRVTGDLDRHRPVIIVPVGGTSGLVLFLHAQADTAVLADDVVRGRLCVTSGKVVAPLFCRPLAHDAVNRDRVNLMGSVARSFGRDPGVTYQRAVRVSHRALSFFLRFLAGGILVIVALSVLRSPLLRCFSLIGGLLEFHQHRVGGCRDIRRCFQCGQHGRILCRSEPNIFVD